MTAPLPVPHVPQARDGYCLPACARMVLLYQGLDRSETSLAQALGTQPDLGTPYSALHRLASRRLTVTLQEWTIPQMLASLAARQPIIAFIRTGFLDYYRPADDFTHAVVLVGATPGQECWLQDPYQPSGPSLASWEGMLAAWAEFSYRGAILNRR